MGFIKALTQGFKGTMGNQWLDFYRPMQGVSDSAALIPAVKVGTDNGMGQNTKGSSNVISNGSKIIVPDGYTLVTIENGTVTGCITEPGDYEFTSDNSASKTLFHSGDGFFSSTLGQTWEKVKFGGIAAAEQLAFYVPNKIKGLRFGTDEPAAWFDSYIGAQVRATARGTYCIEVTDPLLWVTYLPVKYKGADQLILDLNDGDDESSVGGQIFKEVQAVLGQSLSRWAQEPDEQGNKKKLGDLQSNTIGFGKTLTDSLEEGYGWLSEKGCRIGSVTLTVDYDENTKRLEREISEVDAMAQGNRANTFMAVGAGKGMAQGGAGAAMMGMMNMTAMQGFQQQPNYQPGIGPNAYATPQQPMQQQPMMNGQPMQQPMQDPNMMQQAPQAPVQSGADKLIEMKKLLDAGIISQEEFDAAKQQFLGN